MESLCPRCLATFWSMTGADYCATCQEEKTAEGIPEAIDVPPPWDAAAITAAAEEFETWLEERYERRSR